MTNCIFSGMVVNLSFFNFLFLNIKERLDF